MTELRNLATGEDSGGGGYRMDANWGKIPEGWALPDVAAVAVDARDNVYVFNRGEHPIMVFDRDGNFLRSWGEGVFKRPHGLHLSPDDTIFCTDDSDHTVRKFTLDGKLLLTIGTPHKPSPYMSNQPFHRCTHTALSPKAEIYVSDGYGNAAIHKYAPDGRLLKTWGGSGCDPGQFNVPHNICCDDHGWVYVADRENHRIQVFDGDGKYETQWNNMHRPCALGMRGSKAPLFYVGEAGPQLNINRNAPNLGPRISIYSNEGKLVGRFGAAAAGGGPGQFMIPHGIAVDSHGDIYVGEIAHMGWPQLFPGQPAPPGLRALKKLVKID